MESPWDIQRDPAWDTVTPMAAWHVILTLGNGNIASFALSASVHRGSVLCTDATFLVTGVLEETMDPQWSTMAVQWNPMDPQYIPWGPRWDPMGSP